MDKLKLNTYKDVFRADLFEKVLPFWLQYGFDRKFGGINTCLDRKGVLFSDEKSVWMQGRGGWLLSHVCKVLGAGEEYAAMAESALKFAKKYCIDPADGRMYFVVGTDGTPIRKRRYDFSEYFYIMANAEYYGLTGDREYLEEARRYHKLVVDIYNDPANDPFKITPKFLPTAQPMRSMVNDEVLMLVTRTLRVNDPEKAEEYKALERKLALAIPAYYYKEDLGAFLEGVAPDGSYISNTSGGRSINPGHCMEVSWGLERASEELELPELLDAAELAFESGMRYGWDEKYGGLLYMVDAAGFAPQAYEHDMKLWWTHCEAIIASIKLYRATGKEKYAECFERFTDYAFTHFRDEEYGEWYGYLRRDGLPTEPAAKGNVFKGPFHVPRMYCEVLCELERLAK